MESYLNDPLLPDFLRPASTTILYSNLNLSDSDRYDEKNYMYHQYFANVSEKGKPKSGKKSAFFPKNSFPYYNTHQVLKPISRPKHEHMSNRNESIRSINMKEKAFQDFESFVDVPTFFSDQPMAGTSYHTSCDMPDAIYFYGGFQEMLTKEYKEMLKTVTKNFTIPPENIKLICDYDLPLPLDKEKIESMSLKPCQSVRKYHPESKSFMRVYDLTNNCNENDNGANENHKCLKLDLDKIFGLDENSNSNSKSKSDSKKAKSTKSTFVNSSPRSLICSGAAKLSDRYFMIYGGLEIESSITYPDESSCVIKKSLMPNDEFWLFDTMMSKFKEIKISIHPTYSAIFPNSMPRFGHSMESVPTASSNLHPEESFAEIIAHGEDLRKHKHDHFGNHHRDLPSTSFCDHAILFVMGGYKLNDLGNSFVAMNDLWKCDFFFNDKSTADDIVASPIGNFHLVNEMYSYILDADMCQLPNKSTSLKFSGVFTHTDRINWPTPRGFFSMSLVDENELLKYFDWKEYSNIIDEHREQSYFTNMNEGQSYFSNMNEGQLYFNNMSEGQLYFDNMNELLIHSPVPTINSLSNLSVADDQFSLSTHRSSVSQSSRSISPTSISSESCTHTNLISSLKYKVLLVYGGSSIMYTKVVDDKMFSAYYSKSILDDMWIFSFETESWYNLGTYLNVKKKVSICGHSLILLNSSLSIFGGIEEQHYDMSTYEPIQIDVVKKLDVENRRYTQNWEQGKKLVYDFHSYVRNRKAMHDMHDMLAHITPIFTAKGIDLSKIETETYNSYRYNIFDFKTSKWRTAKMALVTDLEFFAPWDIKINDEIISGGVLRDIKLPGYTDEGEIFKKDVKKDNSGGTNGNNDTDNIKMFTVEEQLKYKKKLRDATLIATNGSIVSRDDRILIFSPDVKIIDQKTKKYVEDKQRLVGNGVWEVFSAHY